MKNKFLLFTAAALVIVMNLEAQVTGTLTDSRDGKVYKTITIESQIWMAENLSYYNPEPVFFGYAYDNDEENATTYGRLYTYKTAQILCPTGWRIPNDNDWNTLIDKFGGYEKAGEALKSAKGWYGEGNGTNSSGFSALPGGSRTLDDETFDYSFSFLGKEGAWWTATADGPMKAYFRFMSSGSKVGRLSGYQDDAYSVRCVKDK